MESEETVLTGGSYCRRGKTQLIQTYRAGRTAQGGDGIVVGRTRLSAGYYRRIRPGVAAFCGLSGIRYIIVACLHFRTLYFVSLPHSTFAHPQIRLHRITPSAFMSHYPLSANVGRCIISTVHTPGADIDLRKLSISLLSFGVLLVKHCNLNHLLHWRAQSSISNRYFRSSLFPIPFPGIAKLVLSARFLSSIADVNSFIWPQR